MEEQDDIVGPVQMAAEFALRENPHMKFSIGDVALEWDRLTGERAREIERDIAASGLFIVFGSGKLTRFMLRDSVRIAMIQAGSYRDYLASRKGTAEMSSAELAMVGESDEEDRIRKADEESRSRKKRTDRIILLLGISLLVAGLLAARVLLGKIGHP